MAERLRLVTHPAAAEVAVRRAGLLRALRTHLDARGLIEVEAPVLQPHAGSEPHLHPPRVELEGLPGALWLQTSPELACKRLLCAGLASLYSLGPVFRGGREELSAQHQPEFTLLEWYRPGDDVADLMDDCVALGAAAARALDVEPPPGRRALTVAEAFADLAGVDLLPLLDGELPRFAAHARAAGLTRCRDDDDLETLFGRVLVERVEPLLRRLPGWVFLHDFPAGLAGLAAPDPRDPRRAQRVEAYVRGVELANGYVELRDAQEMARRWRADRKRRRGPAPTPDEDLLAAFASRPPPPTVGMALGVDRLLMVLTGARDLAAVRPLRLDLEPRA